MSLTKRKWDKKHNSFVMLPRKMLRNNEWRMLSPAAREVYIQLKVKYNANNNGNIRLYYSELENIEGLRSPSSKSKAFKELEEKGWVTRTKLGGLFRHFNEYRLTWKHGDADQDRR